MYCGHWLLPHANETVVMRSVAPVSMFICLCLSCSCSNSWKSWPKIFISGMRLCSSCRISRLTAYVKVIGIRSKSKLQEQNEVYKRNLWVVRIRVKGNLVVCLLPNTLHVIDNIALLLLLCYLPVLNQYLVLLSIIVVSFALFISGCLHCIQDYVCARARVS